MRTALHHDPTLDAPLERLAAMYRDAKRIEELLGMYKTHAASYPDDTSGTTVYVRLLSAAGDPQAVHATRTAVARHKDNAYLHYLLSQMLRRSQDPKSLDELDKAIDLSALPRQKIAWMDQLLPEAVNADRQALVDKHLKACAALAGTAAEKLEVAEKMIGYKRHALALELLEAAAKAEPSPQTAVEIELAAASAEVGRDQMELAASRLDRLLGKLTADYWGRAEIMRRRVALVKTDAERTTMIAVARKRLADRPADEAAVLDLAQLLIGFELRRDALSVLLEAGAKKLLGSERIEKLTIELFDRLRDERGREQYLAGRIKSQPARADLVLSRTKSLYLIGERKAALAEFDRLIAGLEAPARITQTLDMARFLRRSSLVSDAATLLARVVELVPERVDLRRELAETYLALGRKQQARELFAKGLPKDAQVENLLDLIQFMIQQELFIEARAVLVEKVQQDETNLELRLTLSDIERRLGNRATGEKLLEQARALSDTGARYRAWLEASAAFYEETETLEAFLTAEKARLDAEQGPWTDTRVERHAALVEVGSRDKQKVDVPALIGQYLNDDLPAPVRTKFRQQFVRALESNPALAPALVEQLELLIEEDPQSAGEYRARLLLLYSRQERHDLIPALLEKIDIAGIKDAALLSQLETLYLAHQQFAQALAVLERLTVLDPTNKGYWERWLSRLALGGNESRLRVAIRRLLTGIERLPLEDETKELLQTHLVDSYWRTVGKHLADGRPAPLADALAQLDSVERIARSPEQSLWVSWNRAYILNRLGRTEPRDEAIRELDRIVADTARQQQAAAAASPPEANPPPLVGPASRAGTGAGAARLAAPTSAEPVISLPDGLTLSLTNARRLLTSTAAQAPPLEAGSRQGPIGELKVQWAFDTDRAPIIRILPVNDAKVLVFDTSGGVHCVQRQTGKLLWRREIASPLTKSAPDPNGNRYDNGYGDGPPAQALVDDQGRLFLGEGGSVVCLSLDDGQVRWKSAETAQEVVGPMARPAISLFLSGGAVLAYDPLSESLASLDPLSGKVRWSREFGGEATPAGVPIGWFNAGASFDGGRLLAYGTRTTLVDAATGESAWTLDPDLVRQFPVKLDPVPAATTPANLAAIPASPYTRHYAGRMNPWSYGGSYGYGGGGFGRYYPAQQQAIQYVDYQQLDANSGQMQLQPGATMALVGPATAWSASFQNGQPRFARLYGQRMLLCDGNGLLIVPIDLPLASKRVSVGGTLVGCTGRMACLLNHAQLSTVDLVTGEMTVVDLSEILGGSAEPRFQAALDGPLVYLTGPGGILCVNVLTHERLFKADWPASVAPEPPPQPQNTSPQNTYSQSYYHFQGIVSQHNGNYGSQYGACLPLVDRVDQGVLYATVSPTRVVALGGADAR